MTGNNTDSTINFIPRMNKEILLEGYKKILKSVYSPKQYYLRMIRFLKDYKPVKIKKSRFKSFRLKTVYYYTKGFVRSVFVLGIFDKGRRYYWKLFFWSAFKRPRVFPMAMTFLVYGYHFRKVFRV